MPSFDEWIVLLRENNVLFTAAAKRAARETRIPHCGTWTAADLVSHVTGVQSWVLGVIARRPEPPDGMRDQNTYPAPDDAAYDEAVDAHAAVAAELADQLEAVGPDGAVWNWWGKDQVGAFWARRMAQEILVHAQDMAAAAGDPWGPVDAAAAADGVDEFLRVFVPSPRVQAVKQMAGSIHVHASEAGRDGIAGEWLLQLGEPTVVTLEHAKGDVALRGPASGLLRWMWNRYDGDGLAELGLESFGDTDLLTRFSGATRL